MTRVKKGSAYMIRVDFAGHGRMCFEGGKEKPYESPEAMLAQLHKALAVVESAITARDERAPVRPQGDPNE